MKKRLLVILFIILFPLMAFGQGAYYAPGAASSTQPGTVELATDAETVTGSATGVATTPANITARLAAPGETGATTPYKDHNRRNIKIVSTTPVTLTESEFCNGLILITTGAGVINLPAGAAGLDGGTCEFQLIAAVAASVDPNGTQVIWDGADYTAGNKATFSGVAGESFKLTWSNTNSRFRMTDKNGVVIDGGA